MTIGTYYKYLTSTKISYFIVSILGVLDLHSHIRLKPIIKFLENYMKDDMHYDILEIGSGGGMNAFEISKIKEKFDFVGFDLHKDAIALSNRLAKELNLDYKIKFICVDATKYDFKNENNKFDFVLLTDFLEHIGNPREFLKKIKPRLKDDAVFIVSVPTYNYPKVFGKAFHENIGHVRKGFNLEELEELFKEIGVKIIHHSYNTGLFSNVGCAIYYRIQLNNKFLDTLKCILLYPFQFLDFFNSRKLSSSLFVVGKNNKFNN